MSDLENAVPASNLFEAELGRQILVSERERASLQALIGVALLLIIGVVKAVHVATANPWPAFNAALPWWRSSLSTSWPCDSCLIDIFARIDNYRR